MESFSKDIENFKIECKDIVIRPFQVGDAKWKYQLSLEPEIQEFLPDWIASRDTHEEWLIKYEIPENEEYFSVMPEITNIDKNKALRFAIVLKETQEFIGWIVSGLKEGLPEPNREIGYAISNKYTKKGYATQAVLGFVGFLFKNTNTKILNATARDYNFASNKVIQKCGFQMQGKVEMDGHVYNWYRLNKEDLEK